MDGGIETVLAINFPSAEVLGQATPLDTSGTPFKSLHQIGSLKDGVRARLKEIMNFEFNFILAGADAFVLVADRSAPSTDPAAPDGTAYFLHEMFHRYQSSKFLAQLGEQDVEGYAFDAGNMGLAALEDRALKAAINDVNDGTHFSRELSEAGALGDG